jgi:hypothetical protein
VWFNSSEPGSGELPVAEGERLKALYSLSDNYYKNRRSLQLMIEAGIPQRAPKLEIEPVPVETDFTEFACAPSI